MAFHHRKLLNESEVDPILAKSCDPFCDAEKNPDEICPFSCIDLCRPVCKIPLMEIPPPPAPVFDAPTEKSHTLPLFLTISIAVLAASFFLFTCYTIYKFYSSWCSSRRRRRSQALEDGGPDDGFLDGDRGPVTEHHIWYIRTIGLQPSVITAITIVKYKRGDGLIDGTDCAVCLNEFQEDETLRLLPKCNHAFHVTCIDTWLRSHINCPMCRAGIANNAAALPSQEQIVRNSGPGTSYEQSISGSDREIRRESETEAREQRTGIGIEDEMVSRAQTGPKVDENSELGGLDRVQPMRRSISADSLSALANASPGQSDRNSDNRWGEVKGRTGFHQSLLRLIERPIQTGPSSMKRSLSCSANVLLSRHNSRDRS